jgi:hypothetical protein
MNNDDPLPSIVTGSLEAVEKRKLDQEVGACSSCCALTSSLCACLESFLAA